MNIETPEAIRPHHVPHMKPTILGGIAIVLLLCLAGIFTVERFIRHDHERDLRQWQDKLNLVAESRASDVHRWVNQHFNELRSIAQNPSLQVYLTELEMKQPSAAGQEAPQKVYVRNMLTFTAERGGFVDASTASLDQIPANVERKGTSGIAILDKTGKVIVATSTMPSLDEAWLEKINATGKGKEGIIDIERSEDDVMQMAFVVPIFALQGEALPEFEAGKIVGILRVDDNLFSLLQHPGITEKTLEAALVRRVENNVQYLSPLMDESRPLSKQLQFNLEQLAEAFAIEQPGAFTMLHDYRSKDVLVTGRGIDHTPWTLVVKIDRNEAMRDSDLRRTSLIVGLALIMGLISVMLLTAWWYVSSRRAQTLSSYFQRMAGDIEAHRALLQLVTDNEPNAVYILDEDGRYRFANRETADEVGMTIEHMLGKSVIDVLGAARAQPTIAACRTALTNQQNFSAVQRTQQQGEETVIRSEYIPIDKIPLPGVTESIPGVLVVDHDITEAIVEREKRLRANRQLIDTLIMLVDRRDPHAGNHSALVSHLAEEIASSMELSNLTVETTRNAGRLMNLGKIVVSSRLLTKADDLSAEERRSIRESLTMSAELLKNVTFDGPVVETLKQAQECWDGSGPHGLKGEEILVEARIIAVANAFIGMISPRAWRNAMEIDEATKILLEQSGTQFDRRIVVALVHFLDNKSGRAVLKSMMERDVPDVANG